MFVELSLDEQALGSSTLVSGVEFIGLGLHIFEPRKLVFWKVLWGVDWLKSVLFDFFKGDFLGDRLRGLKSESGGTGKHDFILSSFFFDGVVNSKSAIKGN